MQKGNHKNGSYTIETERCQVPSKNIREKEAAQIGFNQGNPKTRNPESQVIVLPIQRVKTILNIHKS